MTLLCVVMPVTVCKLRDLGIVDNEGRLTDFQCNPNQAKVLLSRLLYVLNGSGIADYLIMGQRTTFPDNVVYHILRTHEKVLSLC